MLSVEEVRVKECPSCNASVPDSADVCPSCSLEFGDDEGDARKTMVGMSFASEHDESRDGSSRADGGSEESQPLWVPDDASPTGTFRGTGSEVTDDQDDSGDPDDMSANPATRTHDGLPEFDPGRVFGGGRSNKEVAEGHDGGDETTRGEEEDESSRRVEAEDLDSVREAFRKRDDDSLQAGESIEEAPAQRGEAPDAHRGEEPPAPAERDKHEGPRAEDFSGTPGSGIIKLPKKKGDPDHRDERARKKTEPGYASEQSGSGIIKRPKRSSAEGDASTKATDSHEPGDAQEDDSGLIGDNTYIVRQQEGEAMPRDSAVRQTAQVADPAGVTGGWSSAGETAQISSEDREASEQQPRAALAGETDVISEEPEPGSASWVALVGGVIWMIAAGTIWMTATLETVAVGAKLAAAMIGGIWGLFGPFVVEGRMRAYGHIIVGSAAGAALAATLAATGLAFGDIAGLTGAVVLIVAGVLEE